MTTIPKKYAIFLGPDEHGWDYLKGYIEIEDNGNHMDTEFWAKYEDGWEYLIVKLNNGKPAWTEHLKDGIIQIKSYNEFGELE